MKKTSLVLAAALIGAGTLQAGEFVNDERVTDSGKAPAVARYYHHGPGRMAQSRAGGDYKETAQPYYEREQVLVGKFFGNGWGTVNGRLVFLPSEIVAVAPQDTSFSAAALNARRVRLADEE
jgi:hypothetical protein